MSIESPNSQESTSESIKELNEKLDALQKRLDSYDAQNKMASENPDKYAFFNTNDIKHDIDKLRSKILEHSEPVGVTDSEVSEELPDKQETGNIEESSGQKNEVGSSLYEKLGEEELYIDRIKNSPDLRNLVNYISELGDITASDGYVYKKEDIIRTIGSLKDSNDPELQKLTRTYGLRDKVKLLLLQRELGLS